MRVLVTGGAGYIGSVTVAALLADGHDVTVLDDLHRGHRDAVPEDARLVVSDVGEPHDYAGLLEGIDACVHFAAFIEAGESMQAPERFFANNTASTARLLDALVAAEVPRFVLSSTAAVYGEPEQVPITEDHPTVPTNAYGESKLLVERMLAWLSRRRGLRCAALRYFNAAGAVGGLGERHDPETHLIPLVLDAAAGRRDTISVFGDDYPTADGTAVRDYVHVADLADAHVRALTALDDHEHLVCNLGSGTGYSVREVIEVARDVTGADIDVVDAPRRAGDPAALVASADHARDLLGWRPSRGDLRTIVADAWAFHQTLSDLE